jgi:hypothetical protein
MARLGKKIKDYERWVLIGVVIVILATITITGIAPGRCAGPDARADLSGEFLAAPGKRVEVTGEEFVAAERRYWPFFQAIGPTVRYLGTYDRPKRSDPVEETWAHLMLVHAARESGYRVSDDELAGGIRRLLSGGRRGAEADLLFDPKLYDRFVREYYRGTKLDFERTLREVMLKDKFLANVVDAGLLSESFEEAYEGFKGTRERVDLAYAGVPVAQLEERARVTEDARSVLADQERRLQDVAAAARAVRDATARVEDEWKGAHGAYPKDEAELLAGRDGKPAGFEKMPEDPWKRPLRYATSGEDATFTSAGADAEDAADDVAIADVRELQALGVLHAAATALVEWQGATKSFPDSLDRLTTVPESADGRRTLPPLPAVPKDPWGRELVYEPGAATPPGDGPDPAPAAKPVLLSTGADGERGTADDLAAEVSPGKAVVRPGPRISRFLLDRLDPWGHAPVVSLRAPDTWAFRVSSPGPDGVLGNEDDLEGNANDLRMFFESVSLEFELEARREFEAVYVHFPRVPDEIFRAAWDRFPKYRPKEEGPNDPFARFENLEGVYYFPTVERDGKTVETDPADPKDGHGAALVPEGTRGWLVPSHEAFGEGYVAEPPPRENEPLWRVYVEKGWRRILLREQFFEALLFDWLQQARDAAQKHAAWAAGDGKEPEPEKKTFATLLASVADLQPSASEHEAGARFLDHYRTAEPLTRSEWEALPSVGDMQVSTALQQLPTADSYARLPTVIKGSAARAILHGISSSPQRTPEIDEPGVREKVWPRYLRTRAAELAKEELRRVHRTRAADLPIADAVRRAAEERKFEWFEGRTGLFLAAEMPAPLRLPESMPDEEKRRLAREHFVRRQGYATVRPIGGGAATVGDVGRYPIADLEGEDATEAAYLVQVAAREDAPRQEFGARQYAEALDPRMPRGARALGGADRDPAGLASRVQRFYGDFERLRRTFDLRTKTPIEREPEREPRRGRQASR